MSNPEESAFWDSLAEDMKGSDYASLHRKQARKIRRRNWIAVNLGLFGEQLMDLAHAFMATRFLRGATSVWMILSMLFFVMGFSAKQWLFCIYAGIFFGWMLFCSIVGPLSPRDTETDFHTTLEGDEE